MLCDFSPLYLTSNTKSLGLAISIPEVVLIIWVTTFLLDEIRIVIILYQIHIYSISFNETFKLNMFKVLYR